MKLLLPDKHHACNAIAMFIEKGEYQAISSRGQLMCSSDVCSTQIMEQRIRKAYTRIFASLIQGACRHAISARAYTSGTRLDNYNGVSFSIYIELI